MRHRVALAIPWVLAATIIAMGWLEARSRRVHSLRDVHMQEIQQWIDEATAERWTESDDLDYEKKQAELNGLKMPEHRRASKP